MMSKIFNISMGLKALSVGGNKQPKTIARTKIKGLRPFQ